MMSGIRSKNTRPEIVIRNVLHKKGFRFRLHQSGLPGKPDLVFPKYNAVIFTHGCFWHGHDCVLFKWPATRPDFWKNKINGNKQNDKKVLDKLLGEGWRVLVIWECSFKGRGRLELRKVLSATSKWLKSKAGYLEIRGRNLL